MSDHSLPVTLIEHSPSHAHVRIGDTSLHFDFTLTANALQPLFSDPWGMMLWPASVELSAYVKSHVVLNGKSVLELGAGLGLCGMVAALCGARKSVVTERNPELEYLEASARRNGDALSGRDLTVEELDWSKPEAVAQLQSKHGAFDVVLAADCISTDVYGCESREALLTCLAVLVKGNAEVFLCSTKREGDGLGMFVRRVEEIEGFKEIVVVKEGVNEDGDFVVYRIT